MKQEEFIEKINFLVEELGYKTEVSYCKNSTNFITVCNKNGEYQTSILIKYTIVYGFGGIFPISEVEELSTFKEGNEITAQMNNNTIQIIVVRLKGDC